MAALLAAGSDFSTPETAWRSDGAPGETPLQVAEGRGHVEVRLAPDASPNEICKAVQSTDQELCKFSVCSTRSFPGSQVCTVYLVGRHVHLMLTVQITHNQILYAAALVNHVGAALIAAIPDEQHAKCWEGNVIPCPLTLRR